MASFMKNGKQTKQEKTTTLGVPLNATGVLISWSRPKCEHVAGSLWRERESTRHAFPLTRARLCSATVSAEGHKCWVSVGGHIWQAALRTWAQILALQNMTSRRMFTPWEHPLQFHSEEGRNSLLYSLLHWVIGTRVVSSPAPQVATVLTVCMWR